MVKVETTYSTCTAGDIRGVKNIKTLEHCREALKDIYREADTNYERNLCCHYVFFDTELGGGHLFAKFLSDREIGTIVKSPAKYHGRHRNTITGWIWTPPTKAKAFKLAGIKQPKPDPEDWR